MSSDASATSRCRARFFRYKRDKDFASFSYVIGIEGHDSAVAFKDLKTNGVVDITKKLCSLYPLEYSNSEVAGDKKTKAFYSFDDNTIDFWLGRKNAANFINGNPVNFDSSAARKGEPSTNSDDDASFWTTRTVDSELSPSSNSSWLCEDEGVGQAEDVKKRGRSHSASSNSSNSSIESGEDNLSKEEKLKTLIETKFVSQLTNNKRQQNLWRAFFTEYLNSEKGPMSICNLYYFYVTKQLSKNNQGSAIMSIPRNDFSVDPATNTFIISVKFDLATSQGATADEKVQVTQEFRIQMFKQNEEQKLYLQMKDPIICGNSNLPIYKILDNRNIIQRIVDLFCKLLGIPLAQNNTRYITHVVTGESLHPSIDDTQTSTMPTRSLFSMM